ncbi:hypothetical protein Ocin01_03755 [Orchesella cincta]|uniref:Uncharacterized protein n=1 Tax=Orchesella cincta TaxID=48709 RepID=A0A1D2NCG3_ORCCI|nr:hypothetical protein Ocin01_03755 [Orchesella cincta]
MGKILGPKCFLSSTFFLLSILSTYGAVGIVLNYLQLSRVHNFGNWPFNLRPAFVAFIIIQSLIPAAGLFALLATCRKQALFLYCSGFILLGVFTCCMVFGAVCLRASSQDIVDDLYATFKKAPNNPDLIEWFENVQWQGCGANVSKTVRDMSLRLGIEMWIVGGISFLVAIFLLCGVTKLFIATGNSLSFNTRRLKTSRGDAIDINTGSQNVQPTATDTDANNNMSPVITSRSSFGQRGKLRSSEIRKKRLSAKGTERKLSKQLFSLAPILSHTKLVRSNSSRQKCVIHANPSKSFILGEVHSNIMAPAGDGVNEINDTYVDMLWNQPVEKNMSTISTTPNVISSMAVSDSTAPTSRKPVDFTNMMMNDSSMKTTLFTLVSERAFTPSLSQDCSIPFYNDMTRLPNNMEVTTLGQPSPHFSGNKQQRHLHTHPLPTEEESEEEECEVTQPPPTSNTTNVPLQGSGTTARANNNEDIGEIADLVNSQGVSVPPPPLTTSKYLTSSVRSTTLATIHEESESVKGTPGNTKGSSPASGCMTPDISPRQTETKIFHKEGEGPISECPKEDSSENDNNNSSKNIAGDNNSERNSMEKQPQGSLCLTGESISITEKMWSQEINNENESSATSVLSNLAKMPAVVVNEKAVQNEN